MDQIVSRYMIRSPYTVEAEVSVEEALMMMKRHRIRHLPVVDVDELIGVVSERDLREAMATSQSDLLKVGDVMKADVRTVLNTASLADAALLMANEKVGSVIVVNRRGEVLGIITTTDALRVLAQRLNTEEEKDLLKIEGLCELWQPAAGFEGRA